MNKKELILLRHGKSDWSIPCDDFERPLKKRGKLGALRIGAYLKQHSLVADRVLSSPAARARITAEKCVKAMGGSAAEIIFNDNLYESSFTTLLDVLRQQTDDVQSILLVGHNPGLEDLLLFLSKNNVPAGDDGKLLPTATIARLQLEIENWQSLEENLGTLLELTRAKDLSALFPAHKNGATVHRERPDYYYQQSAVIPYRETNKGMEVLLVGSSSKGRWTLPKGIIEPGLSPQQSAQKEALEEAGIQGEVHPEECGQIFLNKWGDTCSVALYFMRVDTVLPEKFWQEKHRGRLWLSLEQAAELISNKDYAPHILSLKEL